MLLKNKVCFYIPEKQQNGKGVKHKVLISNILKKYLSNKFGGYSVNKIVGGWVLPDGQLQEEKIQQVYSFSDNLKLSDIKQIIKIAIRLKKILNQDSIGIEINNKFMLK